MAEGRIVVVGGDPVGSVMAGPAIRCYELSRALFEAGLDVNLVAPSLSDDLPMPWTSAVWSDRETLQPIVEGATAIVIFAPVLAENMWMAELNIPLIVDGYDPGLFETLEAHRGRTLDEQRDWIKDATRHMVEPMRVADVVLVASQRQRHLMLGVLAAVGRVEPRISAEDPTFNSMVRVVPFGTDDAKPIRSGNPLRETCNFSDDAFVAYWGGGLYSWLDPLTLIEAIAHCRDKSIVAAFLAGPHPTPAVGELPLVEVARRRASELGLLGSRVAFVETWIPYNERSNWLVDADVGVSLHLDHLETEFAFRTRILDYLWSGLPIVCSRGDVLSEVVETDDLGIVVEAGNAEALASALDFLASETETEREARRLRLSLEADRRRWSEMAQPLVDFCLSPQLAADRRFPEPVHHGLRWRVGVVVRAMQEALRG